MRERGARIWREVGPGRLAATALFLVLAVLIARFGSTIPFVEAIERVLYDVRATYAMERVEEDERILLVVYTEDTLIDTGVRSPLDRAILARALTNIDALGARGIAIDILIDQATPNDEALASSLGAMRTPTYLAFLDPAVVDPGNLDMQPRQWEFHRALFARLEGSNVRPASVMLRADEDDVVRRWPVQTGELPPVFADALAAESEAQRRYSGSIAYRLPSYADGAVFAMLPIDLLADPAMAAELADLVRGRYVMIGTDLDDVDRFETPFTRIIGAEPIDASLPAAHHRETGNTIAGLEVHAHLLAQLLDGHKFAPIPGWALWGVALIVVIAGGLTNLSDLRLWALAPLILAQIAVFLLVPFLLQRRDVDTLMLPVFGLAMGWAIAYAAVGNAARAVGSDKRRFVQRALARYLPADVARAIVAEPDRLSLTGQKCTIHVIFTDLQGFTALSHAIEPEAVARLLNAYLDRMSDIVLEHGGTLDKFIGDAVVALWGAPIARSGDATRAARCAIAMWQAGEAIRAETPEGAPKIGVTRVGLHHGEAIVGNFGGVGRIQYTALGDAMNTASRLESANKQTGTCILASREAIEEVEEVAFRPLGRVTLSGRATPVEIFEPVPDVTAGAIETVQSCWRRFERGDRAAVDELEALAARRANDAALAKMVYRLKHVEPGGSYVLESK